MKIINCEQGSPEWHQARVATITASMFEECMTRLKSGPNKGDFSSAAKKYAFKLAIERISGELLQEDKLETFEMRRGRELEPDARLLHEERKEILVQQAGFIKADCGRYGASVDGLINDDGVSEYKCFISPDSLMPIILENDMSACTAQVQGGLWITGRKWAHFVLYCPALASIGKELKIIEVERDEAYIEKMKESLGQFDCLVEKYKEFLTQEAA